MNAELVHANVVVAARQLNPTIFSQLWLVRNEVAAEADFQGESIFTPAVVQVRAPHYLLLVLPEQLQFAPIPIEGQHREIVMDKVGRIVRQLPETPYSAVGLNFTWQVGIEAEDFVPFSRALFFRQNPLFAHFNDDDPRFGAYLSKNMLDARLKLDVRPVRVAGPEGSETTEKLLFAFNFHKDVGQDNPVEEIQQLLGRWTEGQEASAAIVGELENWQWR